MIGAARSFDRKAEHHHHKPWREKKYKSSGGYMTENSISMALLFVLIPILPYKKQLLEGNSSSSSSLISRMKLFCMCVCASIESRD